MKRIFMTFSLALLTAILASAQTFQDPETARLLKEDLTRAGCNLHSYEFCEIFDTPAPKGYKPFYISHYGRHGSRSDGGASRYTYVRDILQKAKSQSLLTQDGDSLLNLVNKAIECHDGMSGRLTPKGVQEHARIAERMFGRYSRVFTKGSGNVRAVSSIVPRCIVSMNGFTNELAALDPKLHIFPDTGEKFYAYILNDSSKPLRARAKAEIDSLESGYAYDTLAMMQRFFTDVDAAAKIVGDQVKFEKNAFETGRTLDAFDVDGSIIGLLPFDDVYHGYELLNLDLYLNQCNSKEYGEERMSLTENLVKDVVDKADEAIAGGQYCADLRFGHDYPCAALTAYFGVEGPGNVMDINEARSQYKAFFEMPFAVNLQLIFYRNRDNDVLVKFLFNEKESRLLDVEPVSGPYYRWSDVKASLPYLKKKN